MAQTQHMLVRVIISLVWLPLTSAYCPFAGSNPYWEGAPNVEQVLSNLENLSLTSSVTLGHTHLCQSLLARASKER